MTNLTGEDYLRNKQKSNKLKIDISQLQNQVLMLKDRSDDILTIYCAAEHYSDPFLNG